MIIKLFLSLAYLIPGKSRAKAHILSIILSALAFALLLAALIMARGAHVGLAPLPAIASLLLIWWLGAIYGTARIMQMR